MIHRITVMMFTNKNNKPMMLTKRAVKIVIQVPQKASPAVAWADAWKAATPGMKVQPITTMNVHTVQRTQTKVKNPMMFWKIDLRT